MARARTGSVAHLAPAPLLRRPSATSSTLALAQPEAHPSLHRILERKLVIQKPSIMQKQRVLSVLALRADERARLMARLEVGVIAKRRGRLLKPLRIV